MENKSSKCLNILKKVCIFIVAFSAVIALLALFYLAVDYVFKDLFSYIARAVLANFVVFASIIFLVFKFAIKPNELLEKAQQDIEKNIKKSEQTKEDSNNRLASAQERMQNINVEVKEILENSQQNANVAGERILADADKIAQNTKNDVAKVIQNNQFLLKNDIIKRTSDALIEIAKSNILAELNKNPQLHDKLIDDSIQAIVLNEQIEKV